MKENANVNLVLTMPSTEKLSGMAQQLQKLVARFPATQGEQAA
jgi:hypothetical protein